MQCVAERGLLQEQLLAALDATQPGLELEQGRCTPAKFLITRAPPRHRATAPPRHRATRHALRFAFEVRHHVVDQVRRLETPPVSG
jgi:hypothetical protein